MAGAIVALGAGGCVPIDDQTTLSEARRAVVNPPPSPRPFADQTAAHRVLIAVLDTGFDYNHWALLPGAHFELDPAGRPVRLGWDYVGEDAWPYPTLARNAPDTRRERKNVALSQTIAQNAPQLGDFFSEGRVVEQEIGSQIDHGTHVAALAWGRTAGIGILPYRILPLDPARHAQRWRQIWETALRRAVAEGARIVNLSLAGSETLQDEILTAAHETLNQVALDSASAHVLFVVAVGNTGRWKLPTANTAPNILWVGALDEKGQASAFNSLPLESTDHLVFAPGEKVWSAVPVFYCPHPEIQRAFEARISADDLLPQLGAIATTCLESPGFAEKNGTSVATPLVAHLAAKILLDHPDFGVRELMDAINEAAVPGFIGKLPILRIKASENPWSAERAVMREIRKLVTPRDWSGR